MKITSASTALCVILLVILIRVDETEAHLDSSWLSIFDCLPNQIIRIGVKLAIGMVWAFITSDKYKEIDNVTDVFFDVFGEEMKSFKLNLPDGEVADTGFGYVCWSEGNVEGLDSFEKYDFITEPDKGDRYTTYSMSVRIKKLGVVFKRFYAKSPIYNNHGWIRAALEGMEFKFKFRLKAIDSFFEMLLAAYKNECAIQVVDFQWSKLENCELRALSQVGGIVGSIENGANAFNKMLTQMTTNKLRSYSEDASYQMLYKMLPEDDSPHCRDKELTAKVEKKFPKIKSKVEAQKKRQEQREREEEANPVNNKNKKVRAKKVKEDQEKGVWSDEFYLKCGVRSSDKKG